MRICLSCNNEISNDTWTCSQCDWQPKNSNNIKHFSPEIFGSTESYNPLWYEELSSLEEKNFWFTARNRLICWISKKYIIDKSKYLEVGCGTGFVLQMLCKAFPKWSVYATEAQPEGMKFSQRRVSKKITFYQMDACKIPFCAEFDAIGAFDVIEHIRDDVAAIIQIHAALKPSGVFIVSVPQHMFLWSKYDEAGCHFRRYARNELETKLTNSGFNVMMSTSFNSLLLPAMMASRHLNRYKTNEKVDVLSELRLSPRINFLLSMILRLEFQLIKVGFRLPIGGSRMIVAKKI